MPIHCISTDCKMI